MHIYKAEAKDGLSELIKNNVVACVHQAQSYHPSEVEIVKIKEKATAENKDQVDLYYLKSVLVTTGWNKNDDVFDVAETWSARNTPEDKQFNYMHDEKDIIGHITSCYATDAEGNILEDFNDVSQVPSVFDIVTGSVLYTSWSDKDLQNRMSQIIDEIENEGNWYVSMECIFPNFDYALIDNNGVNKIVRREESSAFLTKHLRAYGGKGEYNGLKIGRLLRNFSFSGVGLVRKPANPRSIILNKDKTKQESYMSDELENIKAELAEAKMYNDKMKEEAEKSKEDNMKAKSDLEAIVADLQSKLSASEEALAAEKSEKEKMMEEMNKMKKEKMMMKRKAQLADAGFAEAELEETLSKFESLADDMFDTVVAALKAKQPPAEKKEGEPAGPEGDKVKNTKAEIEIDNNEADASVLDSAVANHDIAMANTEDDPIEDVKSYAAEWFGKNVLKSTASIK